MPDPLRDVYEAAPRKVPRWVIATALPFAVVATYVATLVREIRAAFRYAWLDVGSEIDAARKAWRR